MSWFCRIHNTAGGVLLGAGLGLLLWLAPAVLAAEKVVLQLKNGDRVTGVLVAEDDASLVLSTPWSPALTVLKEQISARETPPAETAPAPVMEPPMTNMPVKRTVFDNWHGDLMAGVDLRRGQRDSAMYHARAKLTYTKNRFRNIADYSVAYGKINGVQSANRMEGSLKTDFDVGKRLFVYNFAAAGFDRLRQIDLRWQEGAGVGYHLLTLSNLVTDLEAGFNYEDERRANGTRTDNFTPRLAESLTWRLNSRLLIEEKLDFYPRLDRLDDFMVRFETSLRFLLSQNLTLNFSVLDIYDRSTAPGVQPNDLQILSSIGVKF